MHLVAVLISLTSHCDHRRSSRTWKGLTSSAWFHSWRQRLCWMQPGPRMHEGTGCWRKSERSVQKGRVLCSNVPNRSRNRKRDKHCNTDVTSSTDDCPRPRTRGEIICLCCLGTCWCPPGGAGGSDRGDEGLDLPAPALPPAIQPWIRSRKRDETKKSRSDYPACLFIIAWFICTGQKIHAGSSKGINDHGFIMRYFNKNPQKQVSESLL